ncbi:MAG: trigger factor [Mycobacteriales bacterium]
MKTDVENLSPTRVKLTVEVPFDELAPSIASAYRKIAGQVRVQGFRPGKVPPRILDQRVGRGVVLEEAVSEAVPRFYGEAVRANDVAVLAQPEVEVTEFADGGQLVFTAEVDVRPQVDLPDYDGLPVTVEDAEVSDAEVDEQLGGLADRFAMLTTAERPVEPGLFVSIDLEATVDGEALPDASTTGMSYEVGTESLMVGLDDALVGASEGEERAFQTQLVGGEHAGATADVRVTVRSVKVKSLPAFDDEFAQTASEFDTLDELRSDIRSRLSRVRRLQQGAQARDRALEALLERVEVPLPGKVVDAEVEWRRASLQDQLNQAGLSFEQYLDGAGRTAEEVEIELAEGSRQAVAAQFVLDTVASRERLEVSQAELTDAVVRRAQRAGIAPDAYARELLAAGQLGAMTSELVRSKALALVLERATVTDASGRPVDLEALRADFPP